MPYQEQVNLPSPPEGLEYRNMGTMKNHIWSVIARRMKHNHTSWSKKRRKPLGKDTGEKFSGKSYEVVEKMKRPVFEAEQTEEICGKLFSAASVPKSEGKGYFYPKIGHLVGIERRIQGDGKKLFAMAGY